MEQSDLIENGIKIITRSLIEPSLPTIPTAYFYGPPGLGLSDLIVRLINEIKTLSWSINVYHQNANVFTRHIISVIEENKLNGFREHLFSQDVVIIENLGFLRGRSATMSLLSELIDELKEKGKLFVGTGEEHPLELFQANDLGKKIMQGPVMAVPQTSES